MYKSDASGMAFKCNDMKLFTGGTWAMKLSQLHRQEGAVHIATYSLPRLDYVKEQFARRPQDIFLLANERFYEQAREIKRAFPGIRVATHPAMHMKLLLIAPQTVYVTSANFGSSGWAEMGIGMHSPTAYQYTLEEFQRAWGRSTEV
jgi:phosphatidylserine/phosphatidylglycerophosphate/cardiolipin synthase-like enzyme